jgi:hypothetical protein
MHLPATHTYRQALAVAFLVCLLWLLFLSSSIFQRLELPFEAIGLIGFFAPMLAAIVILHRTPLFREMRRGRRLANLFGVALAVLVCAGALLLGLSLALFALGIISPP